MERFGIFGATGTVGRACISVMVEMQRDIHVLVANSNFVEMQKLAEICKPQQVIFASPEAAEQFRSRQSANSTIEVLAGQQQINQAAGQCTTMLAAICGAVGAESILAALAKGRKVLLANKEALVLAGDYMINFAAKSGGEIVPVDSEHSALAELLLLTKDRRRQLKKIWLTASGGPFYSQPTFLDQVIPESALKHPIWKMGKKITIDSATLMNKGLEIIEACRLFNLEPEQVDVVVHPQSMFHAIIEFEDGGSLAQCAPADMRLPLARAITWPDVSPIGFGSINWPELGRLDFLPPDMNRFPCLQLAYDALAIGGSAPAILNAANEIAVERFLQNELRFTQIPEVISGAVSAQAGKVDSMDELFTADARARAYATAWQ